MKYKAGEGRHVALIWGDKNTRTLLVGKRQGKRLLESPMKCERQ